MENPLVYLSQEQARKTMKTTPADRYQSFFKAAGFERSMEFMDREADTIKGTRAELNNMQFKMNEAQDALQEKENVLKEFSRARDLRGTKQALERRRHLQGLAEVLLRLEAQQTEEENRRSAAARLRERTASAGSDRERNEKRRAEIEAKVTEVGALPLLSQTTDTLSPPPTNQLTHPQPPPACLSARHLVGRSARVCCSLQDDNRSS
eukprot:GHVU01093549.1.p1 GENE.GHVU01093549.1~~GHVU01093549.1.p1  ORF type:complete len:208 (+),score=45.86 GHVU01093549.1:161-784(+)